MLTRRRKFKKRRCPHLHLQGLEGLARKMMDAQIQCTDCWALLDGPLVLSKVNRDPLGLFEPQEDWSFGKVVG